ncbi:integrin-linked kinase-associated serine/threonine phosphatase 2C-like [Xenia sp. Carnegie-2017]|uniref:integrin-linked kinase-associated serine/threonine phosphatase 2C-like n=1 Tax=Xenia sp. Carnegie-2017 TaxID=2897299 RepID=UPI001F03656A|nr:integrin-linked kinase-associated serine/threonine phosphatase 2C-like [Xenia sp. Carnegie-2017]
MDLFEDLPPPDSKIANEDSSLFGNLPELKAVKRKSESEDENQPSQKRKLHGNVKFQLKGFVTERMGEREDMQDAHVVLDDFTTEFKDLDIPSDISRLAYYAIFDGHAGAEAAKFAANNLHKNIVQKFPKGDVVNKDKEIKRCLIDAYRKTDEEFLQEASKQNPVLKDGSTAVSILVINDILYVANLGDSKALLCRSSEEGKHSVLSLTKDHSPTQYEERLRIQKAGGNVRDGRVLGILEVSRSFGDGRFKGCGVIATPDVLRCSLTEKDKFLLLACDGLWKGFEVDEALKYINNILEKEMPKVPNATSEEEEETNVFEIACSRIAGDAIRKGSSDNVTVMLVEIKSKSKELI